MGPNNCPETTVKSIEYDLNRLCIKKQNASIKITTFRAKWCLRINFKRNFSLYFYIKLQNPIVATSYLWGSWCKQTSIYSIWGCFHTYYSFSGHIGFEKINFERYQHIFKILYFLILKEGLVLHFNEIDPLLN